MVTTCPERLEKGFVMNFGAASEDVHDDEVGKEEFSGTQRPVVHTQPGNERQRRQDRRLKINCCYTNILTVQATNWGDLIATIKVSDTSLC
jgi:hypothetical protein